LKALVVCYSNSGTTMVVAEYIAGQLGADLDAIAESNPRPPLLDEDMKSQAGGGAFAKCALAAVLGLGSSIEATTKDPAEYDLVVVGTPVWCGTLTPPVRSYLKRHRKSIRKVAFFCTAGDPLKQRVFNQMRSIAGQDAVATLAVKAENVRTDACSTIVADFVAKLKAAGR
jgi:flavodoxin